MEQYKLLKLPDGSDHEYALRFSDGAYVNKQLNQQFKTDVLGGAGLQDADGNVMTQEEATAFIKELP